MSERPAAKLPRPVVLHDGRELLVRNIAPGDYAAVSALVADNFRHAASFRHLDEAARSAYLEANSPEGVREASTHPDNIACLVAADVARGRIVGYRLVRKSRHRVDGGLVAEGKRLHVARDFAGQGLGGALVAISAEIARGDGFTRITAQASGASRDFFEKMGYRCVLGEAANEVLAQRRIVSPIAYLEMTL